MWMHGNAAESEVVLFSLNFKVFDVDSCPFTVASDPLLTHIPQSSGSPGVASPCGHRSVTRAASAPGVAERGRAQAVLVPAAALEGQQPLPACRELVREEEPPPAAAAQAAQPR